MLIGPRTAVFATLDGEFAMDSHSYGIKLLIATDVCFRVNQKVPRDGNDGRTTERLLLGSEVRSAFGAKPATGVSAALLLAIQTVLNPFRPRYGQGQAVRLD